ncbi:MAG TPA: response regulator, partial [Chitinophagaceae bacterium]
DTLGNLAYSLNRMAEALDRTFHSLSNTEWQQTGVAGLNNKMLGQKNLEQLTANVLDYLANYTGSDIGAFYLTLDQKHFELGASVGLDRSKVKRSLTTGEGLAGRSAAARQVIMVDDLPDTDLVVSYAVGSIRPKSVVAIPVYYEDRLKGVIELATVKTYNPVTKQFLEMAAYNIGMAIHSARDHQRLQELLEQTQAQSEELQVQHSELENINTELEAQAEKLQASEEELKVQQEELQQANQELEERSRLLEEKNELILERNREIQLKAKELEQSTRYKSEFLANMSHELRTPLNSILLLSRLLTENHEGNLSGEQIEYARVIQGSGNGLLTLIDEILDLSKIESGKMELEYQHVALNEVVQALDGMFAPLAKEKSIRFEINVTEDLPPMIETDRLRLEQILRNLLSNALKFTAEGSVVLDIENKGTTISFAVKDTGIGIPPDKQQTIFEAFQQADGSTRRKFGGTGLGLSISRELAKLLGGEIRLESEEGKGSTFTLVLPLEKGTVVLPSTLKTETVISEEPVTKEVAGYAPQPAANDTDKTYISNIIPPSIPDDRASIDSGDRVILIVEDDIAFAGALLDYTRKKGYKGVVSVRGDEALSLARQYHPVGILLDVQLPVKSGWEVMEELKGDPATKPIPVHMMSSYQVKTRSLSKGAIDFINKPVAFEQMGEIFEKIEEALNNHPRKVLIVEENPKHAQALSYFLETFDVNAEIRNSVTDGIQALNQQQVDCVILDMGIPAQQSYDTLDQVRKTPGLENVPIIIFTGKNLSHVEEMRIKQYADSIVIKTAHSYQRILDEVSLFLHLVEEHKKDNKPTHKKMKGLEEVLKDKTVLVADDDVRNIFSLTRALESYGMHIVSAMDGRDALKQLQEHTEINIVLMDMMMPEMDGYESTRRIRENPKYKNLPVIAVTAKAMTGDREKCISAGASDYITKPVDVDQLISLLRVWLYQ